MKSHDEIDIWAKEILDNREIPFEESDWLAAQVLLQQNGYAKPQRFWAKFLGWGFICLCALGMALFAWNLNQKKETDLPRSSELRSASSATELRTTEMGAKNTNIENISHSKSTNEVVRSSQLRSASSATELQTTEMGAKNTNIENINHSKSTNEVARSAELRSASSATELRTTEMGAKSTNIENLNYSKSTNEVVSSAELRSAKSATELRTTEMGAKNTNIENISHSKSTDEVVRSAEIRSASSATELRTTNKKLEVLENNKHEEKETKNIAFLSLQNASLAYIFATMPPIQAGKIEKGMARWAFSSYCGIGFSSLSPAPYLGIMSEYRVHPFLKVQIFAELLERKVHNQQVDINPISASNYTPDLTNTYIPTQGLALIAQEKITRNALYYAAYGAGIALPLRRHEIFVNGAYCKLIGTQSQREISIYENSQLLEQKTTKEGGFTKGLNVNDITLGLGYRFALTRRLQLEISAQKGFKDMSNDNFYQNAKKQTVFQIRTGLKYCLF